MHAFLNSMDFGEIGSNSMGGEITRTEVREAILQLNKGKSPGPDGLPNEFYISCTNKLVDLLTSVYNDGIKEGKMHTSFYHNFTFI